MSKITRALEKAARERAQRSESQAIVKAKTATISLVPSGQVDVASAGAIQIDPHIVSAVDSKSPIAEQYRILRTNLQSLRQRPGAKIIVVTSAVHEEGKTVTAINLALTLARQESLRVALVDGDIRRGSVRKWLGLEQADNGLTTALQQGGQLNGSLMKLQSPPLTVLPAGPTVDHPAELLESSSMKRLLQTLKTQFDIIIVDSPPVLPVADPGIMASQVDGVLLVVKAGRTQRKIVAQAQMLLKQVNATLLGCVLTHVEYYVPGYYRYYAQYRYGAKDANGRTDRSRSSDREPQRGQATSLQPEVTDAK